MRSRLLFFTTNTGMLLLANIILCSVIGIYFFLVNRSVVTPKALLAPHIQMGQLDLKVLDIAGMKNFYETQLGMQLLSQDDSSAVLGFHKQSILRLRHTPSLYKSSPSDPGLDQIAIVFASRTGLAKALQRILAQNPSSYLGGTGRGAVGEAFYVTDPQGNTLELYYDTDPSTWPRSSRGNVEGNSLPIDISQYIAQYANQAGDLSMKLGHIQLRIGDLSQGKQFYLNTIGFYAVPMIPEGNSVFMSDGFYHHDVVISQIQGYDGDAIDNYVGLQGFSMLLPDSSYINKLKNRLTEKKVKFESHNSSIIFKDPWGIEITVGIIPGESWITRLSHFFTF